MTRKALTEDELAAALAEMPDWTVKDGKLYRQYKFPSFAQAMGWMMSAAILADKLDHHPEWSNVYNRVTVNLVTHSLNNQISHLDVELARQMEKLFTVYRS
jgi:4a-hydroxytetrahydrobiopterin dehydratase